MSVNVVIRFPVADVAKAVEGLKDQAAVLEEITEETKEAGILHHNFLTGEGEIVVIDEWESAEQFEAFFEGNAKVEQITAAIGLTGAPAVSVFSSIEDAPGTF